MNDGHIRTAWPCMRAADGVAFRFNGDMSLGKTPVIPWKAGAIIPDDEAWITCEPHATREEAERHYYYASLESVREYGVSWSPCAVPECPNPADKMLGNIGMDKAFNGDPLCDEHRTREQLAALHPFTPGMASIHS